MTEKFDMIKEIGLAKFEKEKRDKLESETFGPQKYTPFDFIKSASHHKKNLIREDEQPDVIEKQYNPFIVNKGFSYFQDSILHANEMNQRHNLFKAAQYDYYLGILRSRARFSKWHKLEKDTDLDAIQQYYQCNRLIAKQYLKVLTAEELQNINSKVSKGGA